MLIRETYSLIQSDHPVVLLGTVPCVRYRLLINVLFLILAVIPPGKKLASQTSMYLG